MTKSAHGRYNLFYSRTLSAFSGQKEKKKAPRIKAIRIIKDLRQVVTFYINMVCLFFLWGKNKPAHK